MHATPANANHSYVSRIRGTLGIQLFKNSFFMIMNKMLAAGSGFLFWLLAARFYSMGDVGMATALISSAGLILQFSYLGFDYSIIRFFSKYDRSKMFNTCLILTLPRHWSSAGYTSPSSGYSRRSWPSSRRRSMQPSS